MTETIEEPNGLISDKPENVHQLPIPHPLPFIKPSSEPRPLNQDQRVKLDALIAHFDQNHFALPNNLKTLRALRKKRIKSFTLLNVDEKVVSNESSAASSLNGDVNDERFSELSDWEKCWLSTEQFQRYLRAVKWNLTAAINRTEDAVVWRREYGTDTMKAEDVEPEALTGKELILGYDNDGRPCLHMYPYRQNTKVSPRQIQFVVWTLERTLDLMPPGVESLCLCIDFGANRSDGGGQPTSLGQAKATLDILQTYYAERLGKAVCVNVPMFFWAFYKLVGPFVDPVTKEKICFTRQAAEARNFIDPQQLEKDCFSGDLKFVYNHNVYWPALTRLCEERRSAQLERWRKFGNNRVGLTEWIIKGGHYDPVQDVEALQEKIPGLDLNVESPIAATA